MSYVNLKSFVNRLKCRNHIGEFLSIRRNCCMPNCCRGYDFSYTSNGFGNKNSMKVGAVLKTRYNTLAAQRQKNGRNVYVEPNDCKFFSTRRIDLLTIVRRMAGHSKWQNIRHIKAAKDNEKSKLFQKYGIAIKKAVLDGGPNPKGNNRLAQLLEEAKQCNMPNASIERSIKKAKETRCQTSFMEVQGPGGCFFVIELETDNVSRSVHDVKQICRKHGAIILPEGRTRPVFDQKGVILVNKTKDNSTLECTKAMDVAIEAGAEDVQEMKNDDEETVLKFFCDPGDFNQVKKYIESTNYIIDEANVKYIAKDAAKMLLNDELMDTAGNLCNLLEELPEVVNIYDNIS